MLGYYSLNKEMWSSVVTRKREDYMEWSRTHFINLEYWEDVGDVTIISEEMSSLEKQSYKQIIIDVKRTNPEEVFALKVLKDMLVRMLFVWAFKHPSSGYVQGMNDIAATFMYVFLAEAVYEKKHSKPTSSELNEDDLLTSGYNLIIDDVALLSEETLANIEADTFWWMESFLETLQENYINKQPGIYKILNKVELIIKKKDMDLIEILSSIDYLPEKFVYRWINNILSREFSIQQLIKIWDRILSEEQEVSNCLWYVWAALLLMFAKDLKDLAETPDEIIMYLQDLPTYTV